MKNIAILILLISTLLLSEGKYAGEFISGSTDARSLSLGGIVLTSFNNPSAVYFNPSYLPEMDYNAVLLSHSERFGGIVGQEFSAYKTKFSGIDTGISLIWLNVDDIILTSLENENEDISPENRIIKTGTASDNELAIFVSGGKVINEKINLGGAVKFLYKNTGNESASGLGFDVSGLYKFSPDLIMAANLQDITTSALFWTTGTTEFVKPSLSFNAEYNYRVDYFLTDCKFIGGTKLRTENYSEHSFLSAGPFDAVLSGGLELNFKNIYLRGGYNTDDTWAAGSGINYFGFILDYAFRPDFEDLGNTHKVSLSYNWE